MSSVSSVDCCIEVTIRCLDSVGWAPGRVFIAPIILEGSARGT